MNLKKALIQSLVDEGIDRATAIARVKEYIAAQAGTASARREPELGEEQKAAYQAMCRLQDNLFITGKAGTGKSFLLQYFIQHHSKDQIAVVAPTGVAALNVGGQTIHSLFSMKPCTQDITDEELVKKISDKNREILANLRTLVIDEVSMVSADIMDMIDAKLKRIRDSNEPFGGCQIIAFGDLYQLPPVIAKEEERQFIKDHYGTRYFFAVPAIQSHPFKIIELQHVFRQRDQQFIDVLNHIRTGDIDDEVMRCINDRCVMPPSNNRFITLTGDNATANAINRRELAALPTKVFTYCGFIDGNIEPKDMPTDKNLKLKVGAHVMMLKNDYVDSKDEDGARKIRWANGTLGVISKLTRNKVYVRIHGVEYEVEKSSWDKYQYQYNRSTGRLERIPVGHFEQYPIKLAYAITIHKSQGQTYDSVRIDLSKGAFATGQTYVALSRCRSLETLYLVAPLRKRDVMVSSEVADYMSHREPNRDEIDNTVIKAPVAHDPIKTTKKTHKIKASPTEKTPSRPKQRPNARPILQLDDNLKVVHEYPTVNDAARSVGISTKCIRDATRGIQIHAGGWRWKYKYPGAERFKRRK